MTIRISTNKLLIAAICLLLILNLSIFTTLAWMTDTAQVTNTFTVGKVDIELIETDSDEDGDNKKNEYHLIPGQVYTKDPTMTVLKDSESAYLRMIMTVHGWDAVKEVMKDNDIESFFAFIEGWEDAQWEFIKLTEDPNSKTASFEFRYKEPVSGFDEAGNSKNNELPALFTKFKVPGSLTIEDLAKLKEAGFKMVIEGHAIQSAGFIDAKDANGAIVKPEDAEEAAWAAFEEEEKNEE